MEKRRQKHLAALLFIIVTAMIPIIGSHTISGKYYYLSIIAAGLLFIPFLFIIFRISDISCNSANVFEYLGMKNKFIGRGFAGIYTVYAFITAVTSLRVVGEELKLMSLFNTPMIVIFGFAVALYIYVVNKGYRVMGHFSALYAPVMILGIIAYIILSVNRYEFGNFEPVFLSSVKDISASAFGSITGIFGDCVLLLFVSGMRNHGEKVEPLRKRYFIIAYAAAFICIVATVLNSLLVLGGEALTKLYFPHYISASLISLGFVTRLEIVVDILYFIALNIKITFALYCTVKGLEQTVAGEKGFNGPWYKYINTAVCALCGILAAYLFGTTRDFFAYLQYYRYIGLIYILFLIILWITTEIVERRGRIKARGEGKLNSER